MTFVPQNRASAWIAEWWSSDPPRPIRAIHQAGVASLVIYTFTVGATALWPGASKWVNEPARWVLVAGLLWAFAHGYRATRTLPPSPRLTRLLVGYAIALFVVVVFTRPFHSTDLFTYINRGWQQAGYGVNPYALTVVDTPNGLADPMFFPKWQFNPCPYGFLFALETWGIGLLAGRDYVLTLALHKTAAVATFSLLGLAIWIGLKRFQSESRCLGLFLYAWNPLLLLHHVGHGHNDLQMVLGVAVAVLAAAGGRWLFVFPALAFAALIKLPALAVAPIIAVYMLRRFGWTRSGVSLLLAGLMGLAASTPYLEGLLTRKSEVTEATADDLTSLHNSLPSMVLFPIQLTVPAVKEHKREAVTVIRALAGLGFVIFYAWLLRRSWSQPADATNLVRGVVLALMALVLFSPKFHAWYVGFFLPLALWLPGGERTRRVALALGAGAMFGFTRVYQADFANALVMLAIPLVWALGQQQRDRVSMTEPDTIVMEPRRSYRQAA